MLFIRVLQWKTEDMRQGCSYVADFIVLLE